ncbi:NAD-dependent epimerase/dehydratase family protein [Caldalkalibacillus salinus]|uniref:NAD-dependent epimerase/dehydratase family protein n=1 Tax=Caldalkalibacillus salinus TaxID=2803787 RepID=UPI0019245F14|nr:NAD-dependent epimerase/dehydratase family protein [Caldalkalibacillus salinus]
MTSRKILVTGANGYVGRHLVNYLLKRSTQNTVIGVGRQTKGKVKHGRYQYMQCDLTDTHQVKTMMQHTHFDYIFHFAGQSQSQYSKTSPFPLFHANVIQTTNLLEYVLQFQRHVIKGILVAGTAHEYELTQDLNETALNEHSTTRPVTPYGWSKLLQTQTAQMYATLYDLPIVIARTFNLFGPGDSTGVCATLARKVVQIETGELEPVLALGDPSIQRDFVDVRDAIRAYWLLVRAPYDNGQIVNICRGEAISIQHLIDTLYMYAKRPFTIAVNPRYFRDNDPQVVLGRTDTLFMLTKWVPFKSVKQTILDTLTYYRKT